MHIFAYSFSKFFTGVTSPAPLLGDGYLPRIHPSRRFVARPQRYVPQLRAFSILFVHYRPYWKSQGKVREFHLAWRVVTLIIVSLQSLIHACL